MVVPQILQVVLTFSFLAAGIRASSPAKKPAKSIRDGKIYRVDVEIHAVR